MKKVGKLLVIVLALSMVLSLAACGPSQTNTNGTKTVKIFGNMGGDPANPAALDKIIFDNAAEDIGISVEWELPPTSGYAERIQIMMASGEYPDVVLFPSTTDQAYINAIESGIVLELNKYLTEEAAPNLMKYTYESSWDGVKYYGDDRIMAIPRTSIARNEGIVVRQDWMEELGYGDVFNTETQDIDAATFMEIARRMTTSDPDKNGKNDTFGIAQAANDTTKQWGPIEFSARLYGDLGWYEYPNEEYQYMMPMYSRTSSIYKNELELTRSLYLDKAVDPDGPSLKTSDVSDRFTQGRAGFMPEFSGHTPGIQKKLTQNNPNGKVNYLYARTPEGKVEGNNFSSGFWGQWCILNSCKHPEDVIKLFDYLLSDKSWDIVVNGVEGVDHNTVDGKRVNIEAAPGENLGSAWVGTMVRRNNSPDYFTGSNKLEEAMLYYKPTLDKVFKISQDTLVFSLDNGFTPSVAKQTEFINYQNKMAEGITKISTGALQVSDYDQLLDGWYKAGGETYIKEMNDYIAKMQALKKD